jgi:hypothetical protein
MVKSSGYNSDYIFYVYGSVHHKIIYIEYIWYDIIWYDMIWYIYFTAVGLTPGGSSTSHIYTQTAWCHLLMLFYLKHLYMFRPFLAHHQELLYCLVSRYGKRKCVLWCPVVWCGRSFHGTVWMYTVYLLTYSMEQSSSWEAAHFSQLTKKFPAFYGTRRFFTVLTSARHLSLSWANSIQSHDPISDIKLDIFIPDYIVVLIFVLVSNGSTYRVIESPCAPADYSTNKTQAYEYFNP